MEKARGAAVDIGEQVVVLAEPGLARIDQFEIQHQMGAVELAGAEIGGEQSGNGAASDAAEIAKRIAPVLAGPVGERGVGNDNRPHQVGMGGRQYHRRPTALAIAGGQRPRARRMAGVDFTQESSLRRGGERKHQNASRKKIEQITAGDLLPRREFYAARPAATLRQPKADVYRRAARVC